MPGLAGGQAAVEAAGRLGQERLAPAAWILSAALARRLAADAAAAAGRGAGRGAGFSCGAYAAVGGAGGDPTADAAAAAAAGEAWEAVRRAGAGERAEDRLWLLLRAVYTDQVSTSGRWGWRKLLKWSMLSVVKYPSGQSATDRARTDA